MLSIACLVAVVAASQLQFQPNGYPTKYVPPINRTLMVVGGGFNTPEWNAFEEITDRRPGGQLVWIYGFDASVCRHQAIPEDSALYVVLSLRRQENNLRDLLVTEVLAGHCDNQLREMGDVFKSIKRPIYLEILGECDFYSKLGNFTPQQYQKTFQHIRDVLNRNGVHNVSYVMHMACHKNPSLQQIESFYPGDHYVDLLACSFYGPGNWEGGKRLSQFARKHYKGFAIAESGATFVVQNGLDHWNNFCRPYFEFIRETEAQLVVYMNTGKSSQTAPSDNFLRMPVHIKRGWKREMSKPRYLFSDKNFYDQIDYIP